MQPMHTDACTRNGSRYECLHAIDADHFWIGDLMVDINQLYWEANMHRRPSQTAAQVHTIICDLQYLAYCAKSLTEPENVHYIKHYLAAKALARLNSLGLSTGFSEEG